MQLHHLKGQMQDMYLAAYPDKLLLLDGGCRCDVDVVAKFITQTLARPLSDLNVVIVTHMHPDHAGGAHALRELTGCHIASADKDTQWYGGVRGLFAYMIDLMLARKVVNLMKKPQRRLLYSPYLKPDYRLSHGDAVPHFPDWQVLETSGHTDRDLTVYHEQSKTAYTADLMIKTKRGFIAPFPVYFPKAYRESLRTVQALGLRTQCFAHGGQVCVSHDEYDHFIENNTPNSPRTLKDTLKYKLKRYFP